MHKSPDVLGTSAWQGQYPWLENVLRMLLNWKTWFFEKEGVRLIEHALDSG